VGLTSDIPARARISIVLRKYSLKKTVQISQENRSISEDPGRLSAKIEEKRKGLKR